MKAMSNSTDPRRFLYRDGNLEPATAQRLAAELLKSCDDGELYLQYRASEAFGFDDGRLKTADYSTDAGFGLRGVSGEMTGFAHANELSEAAIRRAGETLTLLDPAKASMAPAPRLNNRHLYTDGDPMGLIPFADKVALCQQIDAAARASSTSPKLAAMPHSTNELAGCTKSRTCRKERRRRRPSPTCALIGSIAD